MKKILLGAVCAVGVAAFSLPFAACGKSGENVKIIDIPLTYEEYGIAVDKNNEELLESINVILDDLLTDGVEYDGKTITISDLFDAESGADNDISIGTVKNTSTNRANELVVATNAAFPPFEYTIGNHFGGVDMQVAKILADKLGKELVIIDMDFNAILGDESTGAAVGVTADIGIAGLTISNDRSEVVTFSHPYYVSNQCIAVLESNTDFDNCTTKEQVIEVLSGYANGTKAGGAKGQSGLYYLEGSEDFGYDGFPNLAISAYNSVGMAVQDLSNGAVKVVCADKDPLNAAIKAINKKN